MSLMQQIHRGRQPMPPRLLLYGIEGIGKSTLASDSPDPIFVQTEDGLSEIDCDKFPLSTTFEDVQAALSELHTEQHDYQTVVIDSLDWLERMIWDALCRQFNVTSINHYWRRVGPRTLISREGRRFRRDVMAILAPMGIEPLTGKLVVHVEVFPPDNRRRDIDNIVESLLDALEHGGAYIDDSQIVKLTIEKGERVEGGKTLVRIRKL